MKTQICKWGTSAGIRIPSPFLKRYNMHIGSSYEILPLEQGILIKPKKYNLQKMIQEMSDHDFHEDLFPDAGMVGEEVW